MAPVTMSHDSQEPGVSDGDQIGRLLKLAGRRQMPDPTDMRRAREAARSEWTVAVRQRGWRGRWRFGLGAMAAALCALAAWLSLRTPTPPAALAEVATFQRVMGTVVVTSVGQGRQTVTGPGFRLRPGARLEISSDSRAALVLIDGTAISFDRATVAVFESAHHVTLERGAAYIDSGRAAGAESALRVETAFGAVRHVGTQFEVRVGAASMRVRVREGLVAVERGTTKWTTAAGEALVVAANGTPSRERIATSGSDWRWVHELSGPFILEGATLQTFLDWIGREQGWHWEIADAALRARADRVVLHGSIEGLTPEEALSAVLPAAGLAYRREGTRLIIEAVGTRGR
jgi:ferric-dicitrate binding protein FerR (iron transport regulator)